MLSGKGFWPFRVGNDGIYQTENKIETIYDAVGSIPERPFSQELTKYNEWRLRRGFIQAVLPSTSAGFFLGFLIGFRQSRLEGRYVGRYKILGRYLAGGASCGLASAAIHHFLLVNNHYEDRFFYPIMSGAVATTIITALTQSGSIGLSVLAGSLLGSCYSLACMGMRWFHNRKVKSFLETQRQMQTPIHKVTPELQPLYRSYLYDNRPVEEEAEGRRKALIVARSGEDDRLDAQAFLNNMTPEIYDWVNFPDWWPLKYPFQSEEQLVLSQRQRDEEVARRTAQVMTMEGGNLVKHRYRGAKHRE